MNNKCNRFKTPTEEEMLKFVKMQILKSTDEELYKMYDDATEILKRVDSGCTKENTIEYLKTEKELIINEIKKRGLAVPTFFNKILYSIIDIATFGKYK